MMDWWSSLSATNQAFYVAAAFFSVFFVWQLVAVLMGMGGDDGLEGHDGGDADFDHGDGGLDDADGHDATAHFKEGAAEDASSTVSAFKLFSVRSIIAFCTLFSWAGSLYLQGGTELGTALIYALLWGLVAMFAISGVFSLLHKLTETGNVRLASAVGGRGTVYLDIPEGGTGEARVMVSNAVQVVKARAVAGAALSSGTPVVVTRVLGPAIVEVKALQDKTG